MKKYKFLCVIIMTFFLASCDLLDRPPLQHPLDAQEFWESETSLELFAREFYTQFFVGYNSGWAVDYTPIRGFTFNDDLTIRGQPTPFDNAVPASLGSQANTPGPAWRGPQWTGPTWYFGWIRKANLMMDRMHRYSKPHLTEGAFNHWMAVARFFRALDYCRLVSVFGDVPFFYRHFDPVIDREMMFRDRDPRGVVMDHVYEDFRFAFNNLRRTGVAGVNRQEVSQDVAAAFIVRWMLFAGSWEHFHDGDPIRARRYLNFAIEMAEHLMQSGRYSISVPHRDLFTTLGLPNIDEAILWRTYLQGSAAHHITSYSNGFEQQPQSANLDLLKSFLTTDGRPWNNSTIAGADDFEYQNLLVTRDPRFESSFAHTLRSTAVGSLLYTAKFAPRFILRETLETGVAPTNPAFASVTNTTAFPVIRLGEILLAYIEAKAILEEMGYYTVTQDDIDRSINVLRARPIDPEATLKGVTRTADMVLPIPDNFDPNRDRGRPDIVGDREVSPLMWEIRRERRMELYAEIPRMLDLRRWRKLHYMNTSANPNIVRGAWVNIQRDFPLRLTAVAATNRNLQVQRMDGTIVVWDGTNAADLVGFYVPNVAVGGALLQRAAFTERSYMSPIGRDQITLYEDHGFTLTQTPGWY